MSDDCEEIIYFWLGDAPGSVKALEQRKRMWFSADPQLDAEIESRFGALLARQAAGANEKWKATPRGRLGLILLLDQFPRNVHRGTAKAFAFDPQALDLCQTGIDAGLDQALEPLERMFFYMPLQHAEALGPQDRSVALFESLAKTRPAEQRAFFEQALEFAREHRELISRFGRFPHRNRVLGRISSVEETAYLESGGATFGQ
ncbi:MAG: DUF924 domain-containing protein [Gammaproteobacteria bacterium]|nr:DUF924 domain-containing protein [Gammaproteobacteria bacterium]